MKIEKLTDNKIRIIIKTDELLAQNIDVKSLSNNTEAAQNLFRDILRQAEKEVGFIVSDSKLLIEAFVSTDGFFVITFTKIQPDVKKTRTKKPKLKVRRKNPYASSKNIIFMFENFDEFCNFCTYINNFCPNSISKIAKKIELYDYNSKFYLSLSNVNTEYDKLSIFYSAVSEFAQLVSTSASFENKLNERGKVIFKHNAIKNGIKYFV